MFLKLVLHCPQLNKKFNTERHPVGSFELLFVNGGPGQSAGNDNHRYLWVLFWEGI